MFYYNQIEETSEDLVHALKVMLYQKDDTVFDKIEFENDSLYKEPLLYAFVNQEKKFWFDSLTIGYQEELEDREFKVKTNKDGVIYLPQICYLKTGSPDAILTVRVGEGGKIKVYSKHEVLNHQREELVYLDCGIEVVTHYHPLFDQIFKDELGVEKDVKVVWENHIDNLNNAFEILAKENNDLYRALLACMRKIMLYEGEQPFSFASLTAHNMVFLKTKPSDNEVFFVDHLTHEGGHVIFNTVTFKSKSELFTLPYNTPFNEVCGVDWEHGDIYSRFHGLFTFYEISKMLSLCLKNNVFEGIKLYELKGRLLFIICKYEIQLELFEIDNLYAEEGKKWMQLFSKFCKELLPLKLSLEKELSIKKQPYDFDFEIFLTQNNQAVH